MPKGREGWADENRQRGRDRALRWQSTAVASSTTPVGPRTRPRTKHSPTSTRSGGAPGPRRNSPYTCYVGAAAANSLEIFTRPKLSGALNLYSSHWARRADPAGALRRGVYKGFIRPPGWEKNGGDHANCGAVHEVTEASTHH